MYVASFLGLLILAIITLFFVRKEIFIQYLKYLEPHVMVVPMTIILKSLTDIKSLVFIYLDQICTKMHGLSTFFISDAFYSNADFYIYVFDLHVSKSSVPSRSENIINNHIPIYFCEIF